MADMIRSTARRKPLAPSRHDQILHRVAAEGSVSVAELAGAFGVSRETIRRDLKQLAERGQLGIVHGGAARLEAREPALDQRLAENIAGKMAIGREAAALVQDGMVVLLDSGTTTIEVARVLQSRRGLTVCTPSLPIALLLCHEPGNRVHLFGGEIDPNEEATSGIDALEAVGRFRVDVAFLGGGGLAPDGEVTDYARAGAELRGRMITAAGRAFFLLDSTKFQRLTPVRIPHFWSASGLIVDAPLPPTPRSALTERGLTITVARPDM